MGKSKRDGKEEEIRLLLQKQVSKVSIAKIVEVSRTALLNFIRTRKLDLKPREYGPKEVRAVRRKLKASQALLAKFMGVNTQTVSSWEQGRRKVPPMARRYLDDLVDIPALWATRIGDAGKAR